MYGRIVHTLCQKEPYNEHIADGTVGRGYPMFYMRVNSSQATSFGYLVGPGITFQTVTVSMVTVLCLPKLFGPSKIPM